MLPVVLGGLGERRRLSAAHTPCSLPWALLSFAAVALLFSSFTQVLGVSQKACAGLPL